MKSAWSNAWTPRDRRPIPEWAAENVTLAPVLTVSGAFSIENSLHFEAPFTAFRSEDVRELNILAPPRSAKSLIADMCAMWTIECDPASILHIFPDDKLAKSYAETRFMPMLRSVDSITEQFDQVNRHATRIKEVIFSNGLPYICCGPAISNLQARPFRVVIGDEIWCWPQGRLREAKARMQDFARQHRNKFIGLSQGGEQGDDWSDQTESGTMHEWSVCCQKCKKLFEPVWDGKRSDGSAYGIRYDSPAESGSRLDDIAFALNSIRYECPSCGHPHTDSRRVKDFWNVNGSYVSDPAGNPKRKTFRWNSLIIDPWADQLEEWMRAQDAYDEGNSMALKQFYQKRLAKHYDPEAVERVFELPALEVFSDDAGYEFGTLLVDVQQDHFWALVMEWTSDGSFRIPTAQKLHSWSDIEELQTEFKIPDQRVFIDGGQGSRQAEIYAHCASNGHMDGRVWRCWNVFKGADRSEGWKHEVRRKSKTGRKAQFAWKPYSPVQKGDPLVGLRSGDERRQELRGKFCKVVYWSNPIIKGIAKVRRDEITSGNERSQVLKGDWNDEFARQLNGEKLQKVRNKSTGAESLRWVRIGQRDNHLWDCLCMGITAAAIAGLLNAALPE